jgi:hypothetical protein
MLRGRESGMRALWEPPPATLPELRGHFFSVIVAGRRRMGEAVV